MMMNIIMSAICCHQAMVSDKKKCKADPRFVPSQWETSLQSNAVSHWQGTNLESALNLLLEPQGLHRIPGWPHGLFQFAILVQHFWKNPAICNAILVVGWVITYMRGLSKYGRQYHRKRQVCDDTNLPLSKKPSTGPCFNGTTIFPGIKNTIITTRHMRRWPHWSILDFSMTCEWI